MDRDGLDRAITEQTFGPADAHAALSAAMAKLAIRASGGQIAARGRYFESYSTPESQVLTDQVDPVRFEQAFVNILNNAVKYTERGGCVEISYTIKNNVVEIRIKDNGIGIAQDHLEEIFTPFWQAYNTVSSASGIGVGLSLTKHSIEIHGGSIRAESAGKGHGSTFVMTLPSSKGDLQKDRRATARSNEKPSRLRILVVDDNQAASNSLAKLLTMKGHEARAVYSGEQGIFTAEVFMPDVIILDVGLPGMSGYEVAEKLRSKGFKNKIIALSGYGQPEDKQKAVDSGCDYHFTKPIAIAGLEDYLALNNITSNPL